MMSNYVPSKGDYFRVTYLTNIPILNTNDYPIEYKPTIHNANRERDAVINRDDDKIFYCTGVDESIILGEEFFSDGSGFINEVVGSYYLIDAKLEGMRIPNLETHALRRLQQKLFIFKNKISRYEPVGPEIISAIFKRLPFNDTDVKTLYPEVKLNETITENNQEQYANVSVREEDMSRAKSIMMSHGISPTFMFQVPEGWNNSNHHRNYLPSFQPQGQKKNLPPKLDGGDRNF